MARMAPQDIDEQAISEESIYDRFISVEDYLRIEESSPIRHEYVAGMLYAMTGGSLRHSELVGNVYTAVRPGARQQRCRIYSSDALVAVDDEHLYYPDVVVACDARDTDERILKHPCLVVEVLSPSTRATDRREKASAYRTIASLKSYVIVHQDRVRIEHYYRDDDGVWHLEFLTDGAVTMRCPSMDLQLADIYEEFPLTESE
jgi:Uma2 family endonuclease